MPIVLAAALAVAPTLPHCTWDRPGHNPFIGDVVAAVDRYQDIPVATRAALKARMARRQYDEIATIRRDSIDGRAHYAPEIRDMHFGQGQVCATVTRARWTPQMMERGLVYCEDGHCILVPTVCRNVSRIQRLAPATAAGPAGPGAAPTGGGGGDGGGGQAAGGTADDPGAALVAALEMAPPGAGLTPAAGGAAPDSFAAVAGLSVADAAGPAAGALPAAGATGMVIAPAEVGRLGPTDPRELVPTPWPASPVGNPPLLLAQAVPEPGSAGLLAGGLASLAGWVAWRRRRSRG